MSATVAIAELLSAIVARTTPLERADIKLLIEAFRSVFVTCVYYRWGEEDEEDGRKVCIPARWDADQQRSHAAICAHCPTFRAADVKT